MDKESADLDVAIVGGGPGGLATAAAILSALGEHTRVQVYESMKQYTLQGSAVGLSANAQHALEAIHPDLLARFLEHGLQLSTFRQYDLKGNYVKNSDIRMQVSDQLYEKYGKKTVLLGWHEIRQLLFEYLPSGTVEFDKQMTSYDEDADGVILHFDRDQPSVRAKILIGADGYFSRIRKQCLNDGPPMFAGCVMWRARIAAPEEGIYAGEHGSSWREPDAPIMSGPFAMLIQMGTLEDTKHKPWTWILGAPLATLQKAGVQFDPEVRGLKAIQGDADSGSALENALKIFKNMPKSLMDIVKRTDPSTVTQHGLYMRPLTDPSLHPLVAKAPPAEAPGTPPNEEEQKPATPVACKPSEPATAQKSIQLPKTDEQPGAQEADMASADAVPVLQKETQNLSLGTSNPKPSPEDIPNLHAKTAENAADFNQSDAKPTGSPAEMNGRALPIGAPTPVGEPSVSTGNWTSSKGTASVPMEKLAPVGVPSATKGSPTASDISPEKNVGGTSAAGKGQESSADDDDDVCWGRGRVSLLGDAAHATIPNGQGLALAIEDAVVLAWHLRRQGLSPKALRSYERERPARVKAIHLKGVDNASAEDRERYIYKPTFKPLWCAQAATSAETTCISDFQP
ncbi:hypothetical protein ABBQ32_004168 [Trebouxia sp. C0010 RCD-2024]